MNKCDFRFEELLIIFSDFSWFYYFIKSLYFNLIYWLWWGKCMSPLDKVKILSFAFHYAILKDYFCFFLSFFLLYLLLHCLFSLPPSLMAFFLDKVEVLFSLYNVVLEDFSFSLFLYFSFSLFFSLSLSIPLYLSLSFTLFSTTLFLYLTLFSTNLFLFLSPSFPPLSFSLSPSFSPLSFSLPLTFLSLSFSLSFFFMASKTIFPFS